ncbi:MAG TPA: hypothetical protein VFY13_08515 [Luteolibacter sp.]|nr:hypothetical protein [Luteolibacter sp.]
MNGVARWSKQTLADGAWLRADFGELSMVVLNAQQEWRIARLKPGQMTLPAAGGLRDLPDGLDWERWEHAPGDTQFHFRPTYPTLPVVARPLSVLNLAPKGAVTFFIGIPAWIEIVADCEGNAVPLTAFPTIELSKTWHGTPLAGHLGFALKTRARRVFEPAGWSEYEIACPISLANDGEAMLPFNRLYLETDHLSVFEHEGLLWSNAARIRSADAQAELSDITYAKRPAKPYDAAVEITPPRKGRARKSTMRSAFNKVLDSFNPLER